MNWAEAPYGVRTALHFGLLTARVGGTLLSSPLTLVLAGSQPRNIEFNVKFKSGGQSVRRTRLDRGDMFGWVGLQGPCGSPHLENREMWGTRCQSGSWAIWSLGCCLVA